MSWFNDYPAIPSLTDATRLLAEQGGSTGTLLGSVIKTYVAANSSSILNSDSTLAGTPANTTKTALRTFAIPAATLSVDGWFIHSYHWGTIAATAGTKRIFLAFGATEIDSGAQAFSSSAGTWVVESIVRRTAAGNQDMLTRIAISTGTVTWAGELSGFNSFTEPAENLNGAVNLVLSGQNGNPVASDIRYEGSIILLNS